jgi:oxygen-independent coproporphyrinogen-3 oxidase
MKLIRFDRNRFRKRHGLDLVRLCEPTVRQLQEEDFITIEDDAIVLTRKGILYGDYTGRVLANALESLAN